MVRLGGSSDSFGAVSDLSRGHAAWPQLGGWIEQRATQVLELAQPGGGHREAAPAAGGPVQDGPDQGEAAGLAGEPADDLDPAAGLAEGSFDEVGMPDAVGLRDYPEPWTGKESAPHPARDARESGSLGRAMHTGSEGR